jgi:hypothetical protein
VLKLLLKKIIEKAMSMKTNADDGTGNSEKDWEIFDVLCQNMDKVRVMSSSHNSSLYHHISLTYV